MIFINYYNKAYELPLKISKQNHQNKFCDLIV